MGGLRSLFTAVLVREAWYFVPGRRSSGSASLLRPSREYSGPIRSSSMMTLSDLGPESYLIDAEGCARVRDHPITKW